MDQPIPEFTAVARVTPEAQVMIAQSGSMLAMVRSYVIDSPEVAEVVNDDLRNIKGAAKKLDDIRKSIVKPLDEARANVQAFFVPALEQLKLAEDHCKTLLLGWNEKIEAERRAEQQRLEEASRKARQEAEAKAAAERAKAEEIAREERRKAEEAEAARQKALAEGKAKAAAKAAAQAAAAQEKAAAAIENAEIRIAQDEAMMPIPVAVPATPEMDVAGLSFRTIWKARVVDKQALIRAAANDQQIAALLVVDEKAANRLAGALKDALNIPGLEVYKEKKAASRST